MAENKLQEAYRALQERAKNGDQRATELLIQLEKTETDFLDALDQSYAESRGRLSKEREHVIPEPRLSREEALKIVMENNRNGLY